MSGVGRGEAPCATDGRRLTLMKPDRSRSPIGGSMARRIGAICVVMTWLHAVPTALFAQTGAGSIAGTVRDATGGVLPGVTVEASSPVLIEKVRTGTTDGEGQYKITELRPGTYTVTFSLTGFS